MITHQFASRVSLRRDIIESFAQSPFHLPAIRSLDAFELHPKITFIIGENGSGTSTLLETIAVSLGFNTEGQSLLATDREQILVGQNSQFIITTHSSILMAYPDA